jgi:hypothetical protein
MKAPPLLASCSSGFAPAGAFAFFFFPAFFFGTSHSQNGMNDSIYTKRVRIKNAKHNITTHNTNVCE